MGAAMGAAPAFTLSYQIDRHDRLVVLSESWREFALANDGAAVLPERVLGRRLWDFVQDRHLGQLYRHLVARVRSGPAVEFPYRCDSPAQRRLFLMRVAPAEKDRIEFRSVLQSAEDREWINLLDARARRGPGVVRLCSWCLRVALGPEEWVELEEAVTQLRLLEVDRPPDLTHGICPRCLEKMVRLLPGLPTGG